MRDSRDSGLVTWGTTPECQQFDRYRDRWQQPVTPKSVWGKSMEFSDAGRFVDEDAHADVAVIVVTYNSGADVPMLIDDLRAPACDLAIRLIVVDNSSTDDTADVVAAHDDIVLLEAGGNLGYAGGINAGLG